MSGADGKTTVEEGSRGPSPGSPQLPGNLTTLVWPEPSRALGGMTYSHSTYLSATDTLLAIHVHLQVSYHLNQKFKKGQLVNFNECHRAQEEEEIPGDTTVWVIWVVWN